MNHKLVIFIAVLLSWPAYAQAPSEEERATLQIAYVEFAPFVYTDDNGEATGSAKTLSDRIAARAGYELEWESLPRNRIGRYLKSGELDMWLGVAGLPDLQAHTLETRTPIASLNLSAYHSPQLPEVKNIEDLRGKSLILISGYTYMKVLEEIMTDPRTTYSRAPHHAASLQMLMMGRGDYLLNYDQPLARAMEEHPPMIPLQRSPLLTREAIFLVSRQTREAETVVRRLNTAYQALKEEDLTGTAYPGNP